MVKDTVISHAIHFSNNTNGDSTLRLVQTAEDKTPLWMTLSAQWLYKQISDLIEESDADSDVSIRKFQHKWDQFSIIVRFEGKDESLASQPAIVGAHQDSVNRRNPLWGRSPGADGDGSRTVTTLEVFRSFVGTGFRPTRRVEFHWYSAEEAGLLGSQDVAENYEKKDIEVIVMIQVSRSIQALAILVQVVLVYAIGVFNFANFYS
ncbi:hypothetical protein KI688_005054 [Linnemannia hyalina]|uniref:Peptide hydrolase n=1 Tax=Linnemannia hyalina TaxID=64524 RepID=A0A9P7XLL1_9FUNG|nr:hypothetical protein KI688_005054 [Linnemannia hyalina]